MLAHSSLRMAYSSVCKHNIMLNVGVFATILTLFSHWLCVFLGIKYVVTRPKSKYFLNNCHSFVLTKLPVLHDACAA